MNLTTPELEIKLGQRIRDLRLDQNLTQAEVARRVGVHRNRIMALESGEGTTVSTLLGVLRALGREGWLDNVAIVSRTNPFSLTRDAQPRQRARKSGHKKTVAPE